MNNRNEQQITFQDLSFGLKIAIIMAWIIGVIWGLFFLVGFIAGASGTV